MTRALFSKLSFSPLLVIAGLSGCGDTGNSNTAGGQDPYGQSGYGGQPPGQPCQNLTIQPCTCNGAPGVQRCENSVWGVCTCGSGQGTGGFGGGPPPPPPGGQGQPGQVCGDGMITGTEQCDGQNQAGQSCETWTMGARSGGYLICRETCMFDISMCGPGQGGQGGQGGTFGTGGTVGVGGGPVGGTTGQP